MKGAAILVLLILTATSCKVKETENSGVVNPPSIVLTVTLPNGGESIKEGSSYDIKWTSNSQALIKIQYSIDNGSNWTLLADSITNTGRYTWFPVPNRLSDQCKIKVETIDGNFKDQSDYVFYIIRNDNQSLSLKSPNGGESWEAGSQKQIMWYSSGIDSVRLEYTTDGGSQWSLIGVDKINIGKYTWTPVPYAPTQNAKIRIADAKDRIPIIESNQTFSILRGAYLKLNVPAGGERWISGGTGLIKWESENVDNVKIQYSTNAGADWITIVETTPSNGTYNWENIPQHNSTLCKIRISDVPANHLIAESGSYFTIANQIYKSIHVESPNGSEIYYAGAQSTIKWNSVNVQFVTIAFTPNNGNNWEKIVDRISNTNKLEWTIPGRVSNTCKIQVKDSDDQTIYDESDGLFTIRNPKQITLIYPNGSEIFYTGDSLTVFWSSGGIANVNIQYSISSEGSNRNWIDIARGIKNYNCFRTVFTEIADGYKIRISDASDDLLSDESDLPFSVVTRNSVIINKGEKTEKFMKDRAGK